MLGLLTVNWAQMANREGVRGFIWRAQQQNEGKHDHRDCAAGKCEHLLVSLTGSYCENCCRFSFADIHKTYTQMEIPQKRRGGSCCSSSEAVKRGWCDAATLKEACVSACFFFFFFTLRAHNRQWSRDEATCRDAVKVTHEMICGELKTHYICSFLFTNVNLYAYEK